MGRYAMINKATKYVVNVVEWDGNLETWAPPTGHEMVEDPQAQASPGGTWDGNAFTPPPSGGPPEAREGQAQKGETQKRSPALKRR